VTNVSNVAADAGHPASSGDTLNVLVRGLDPAAAADLSRVRVTVAGVDMTVLSINPVQGQTGVFQIQFLLTQSVGGAQAPVAVWVDGSSSNIFNITVR
jgi:uncharacterized protein (TIGR03437 family)